MEISNLDIPENTYNKDSHTTKFGSQTSLPSKFPTSKPVTPLRMYTIESNKDEFRNPYIPKHTSHVDSNFSTGVIPPTSLSSPTLLIPKSII